MALCVRDERVAMTVQVGQHSRVDVVLRRRNKNLRLEMALCTHQRRTHLRLLHVAVSLKGREDRMMSDSIENLSTSLVMVCTLHVRRTGAPKDNCCRTMLM